jgi:N-acetylneuraminic acid mutarotase
MKALISGILVGLCLLTLGGLSAQSYQIPVYSINSGGVPCSGGGYSNKGSAGQVPQGVCTGGGYSCSGGLWYGWVALGMTPVSGWAPRASIPGGPKSKAVRDGGALTYDAGSGSVYAFKGNNRLEFYQYNTSANTWETKESIPAIGSSGKKKAVKKGAALVAAEGKLYATKGNNTLEFWEHSPSDKSYPWTQKADVPAGIKNVREGAGLAAAKIGDTMYVYLLKGSSTQEFYRFNTLTNTWVAMPSAPSGLSGKPFKNGTCMEANPLPSPFADAAGTLYALKGSYNEFYAYDLTANSWATKTALPLIGASGRKKKVKDGAGLASHGATLYALKGGNTQEFWSYQADSDRWVQKPDIPLGGGKRVKGGGALTYAVLPHALYALKGNNTFEFWQYTPGTANGLQLAANSPNTLSNSSLVGELAHPRHLTLTIAPNPFSGTATISYSLPQAGNISLKLYDVSGKLVTVFRNGYDDAGSYLTNLDATELARGIYVLKLETESHTTTQKLIIE